LGRDTGATEVHRNQGSQSKQHQRDSFAQLPRPSAEAGRQDEIVEKVDCLDQKLSVHARKHAALTALFRTLLHQLMTAQIRVHNLNLPELESL
jgi:hypothetical protein